MPRARVAAALVLPCALTLSTCSSGTPVIELSQFAGASSTPLPTPPTQTVTVTEIDRQTITATVVTTATVVATPTVTVTVPASPSLGTSPVFNRPVALADCTSLVMDVRLLDRMSLSGNAAALQLDLMAQHLARLGANGPPPGLDAPSYYGRLASLGLFARAASDEARASSPVAASRYAVIRRETGVLLALVNGALTTTFTLPAPPPRPTSTTTR